MVFKKKTIVSTIFYPILVLSRTTYTALGKGNVPMGEAPSIVVKADADRVVSRERTTCKVEVQVTTRHRSIYQSTTHIGAS